MKCVKCIKGHFYDKEKYAECPYCGSAKPTQDIKQISAHIKQLSALGIRNLEEIDDNRISDEITQNIYEITQNIYEIARNNESLEFRALRQLYKYDVLSCFTVNTDSQRPDKYQKILENFNRNFITEFINYDRRVPMFWSPPYKLTNKARNVIESNEAIKRSLQGNSLDEVDKIRRKFDMYMEDDEKYRIIKDIMLSFNGYSTSSMTISHVELCFNGIIVEKVITFGLSDTFDYYFSIEPIIKDYIIKNYDFS